MRRSTKRPKRLRPGEMLNTEAVLEDVGLGDISLSEARRSKIVKPIPVGKENWYAADELIEWTKSLPRK